jgi:hypothetical protein
MPSEKDTRDWWDGLTLEERHWYAKRIVQDASTRTWSLWSEEWDRLSATQRLMTARYREQSRK